jgi:hypothetical protein
LEAVLHSRIALLLQDIVNAPGGLQFIVFIPDPQYEQAFPGIRPQAANYDSIDTLIRLHGLHNLGHTSQQQVEAWLQCIGPVRDFFNNLRELEPLKPGGAPTSLTRVVLDVEAGGLFWATVGNYGKLFAATMDQQPLNTGVAERHFAGAVKAIRDALKRLAAKGVPHGR